MPIVCGFLAGVSSFLPYWLLGMVLTSGPQYWLVAGGVLLLHAVWSLFSTEATVNMAQRLARRAPPRLGSAGAALGVFYYLVLVVIVVASTIVASFVSPASAAAVGAFIMSAVSGLLARVVY